jgi:hypothetical protein
LGKKKARNSHFYRWERFIGLIAKIMDVVK